MRYCVFLLLGGLLGAVYGCGSAGSVIDSLSNNTSGDMVRGVKLQAGTDMSGGSPVPSVTFTMGSLARKGKCDRTVMVIDNNTTDIVSESYNVDAEYENVDTDTNAPRQFLKKEKRQAVNNQLNDGIVVHQTNNFSTGINSPFNLGGNTDISIGKK